MPFPEEPFVGAAIPLRPGGGLIGELLATREQLEDLATRGGSLRELDDARRRRDNLSRAVLDLGFSAELVSRFAGTSRERIERLAASS